ncbi:hypothetical protein B0T22DRAFT_513888 [Podospora appendiculata]|uniref:Ankyrin repeat protein n=1 Tax=Podospora appendiculata TaxID=314037 RepID=A0AAE1CDG3_9PEZI|nr:hypothetical protein B0T22DRAFT_513888 [Podospora appendiculata]
MVDSPSATGGRYTSDPSSTIQIDENHSNMVKFQHNDHRIPVIILKIRKICLLDQNLRSFRVPDVSPLQRMGLNEERFEPVDNGVDHDSPTASSSHGLEPSSWDYDSKVFDGLLRSLLSQLLKREPRLQPILDAMLDKRFQNELKLLTPTTTLRSDIERFLRRHFHGILSRLIADSTAGSKSTIRDHDVERAWTEVSGMSTDPETFTKAAYNSLMSKWCRDCLNLNDLICDFLERHGLYVKDTGTTSDREELEKLEEQIDELAKRQRSRQTLRGLRQVFDQKLFELEVCSFFDALDEYDGRPEVVSEFLKDLVKNSPLSKTKAKILFSSRPWPIVFDEFGSCPGFKIHEHTQEDIVAYCAGLMSHDSRAKTLIMPMALDITRRARGVFLWVRLAMRDLMEVSKNDRDTTNLAEMSGRPQQCLDSVPDELHDYYSSIIQRLPSDTRKETFILLECLSRATFDLKLNQVPLLIQSGLAQSFHASEFRNSYYTKAQSIGLDVYLRTISGGLADIAEDDRPRTRNLHLILLEDAPANSDGNVSVQLLHQTCKEWVGSSTLKYIVLQDRANMTWENGHSFFVKFHTKQVILNRLQGDTLPGSIVFTHAKKSEDTTGVSQYAYLSQIPTVYYGNMKFQHDLAKRVSGLTLAVRQGMWLYLKDALRHDKHVFEYTVEPLFSALMVRGEKQIRMTERQRLDLTSGESIATTSNIVDMGRFLLENGFNIGQDQGGVLALVFIMWTSPNREAAQQYIDLVILAVEKSLLPVKFRMSHPNYSFRGQNFHPLHISPPSLATHLLDRGARVNVLSSMRTTPLDYLLHPGPCIGGKCSTGIGSIKRLASSSSTVENCSEKKVTPSWKTSLTSYPKAGSISAH